MARSVFSMIESPLHIKFSALYKTLGLIEFKPRSMREAIKQVKKQTPDFLVADFIYGYGNNYAGANLGNLDVLLSSMQRYSPATRVIVLVQKDELQYAEKLAQLFPIYRTFAYPLSPLQIEEALKVL